MHLDPQLRVLTMLPNVLSLVQFILKMLSFYRTKSKGGDDTIRVKNFCQSSENSGNHDANIPSFGQELSNDSTGMENGATKDCYNGIKNFCDDSNSGTDSIAVNVEVISI